MEKNNETKQRKNSSCHQLIKLFGWRIYVSKVRMRNKGLGKGARNRMHAAAWVAGDHRCQACGCETEHYYDMCYHSRLDATHTSEERWAPENTIILCKKCNAEHQFGKTRSYYRYRDSDIRKAMEALGHGDRACREVIETLAALPLPETFTAN